MNGAVIAIEEARAKLADALDAARRRAERGTRRARTVPDRRPGAATLLPNTSGHRAA